LLVTDGTGTSGELAEIAHHLTTAPDYLLNSSLLTNKDEQLTDKTNTSLCWEEPLQDKALAGTAHIAKSSTRDVRDVRLAKMENTLLKSQLVSSLMENRLLAQWSVTCLKNNSASQLSHLETKQLPHLGPTYISQRMSQLCTASSYLTLASKEKLAGTCATPVLPAVPAEIRRTAGRPKSLIEGAVVGKRLETKVTSATGKLKPNRLKKVNVSVPEQVDSIEHVSSFELPSYELTHEQVDSEKTELFVAPEKEELSEQLMRSVADVQSIKVR